MYGVYVLNIYFHKVLVQKKSMIALKHTKTTSIVGKPVFFFKLNAFAVVCCTLITKSMKRYVIALPTSYLRIKYIHK